MNQLTTGVLFLMSSLYGGAQTGNQVASVITSQIPNEAQAIESQVDEKSTFINDTKSMEAYLRKEYADYPILVDIARCESNFKQFDKDGTPIRGIVNKADIGVMQINEKYHAETAVKLGLDLGTVEGNVAYGKHLYEEQGSAPWSASSKCWSVGNAVAKR